MYIVWNTEHNTPSTSHRKMGKYKTSTSALHMYGMVTHKIYNTLTYSLTHSLRYVLRKNDENFHAN